MASSLKNLSTYDPSDLPEASSMQFAVIVSDWNAHITHALYQGCVDTLLKSGVYSDNIVTVQVPGAFELTTAATIVAKHHAKLNAIICLGCVIKGETTHNEYINHAVAQGLTNLSIQYQKPFIFGLLTPNDEQQAIDRAGGLHGNKGVEAAVTALRMADLKLSSREVEIKGFKNN
jgi:6,7-dimethyl-8-ribityllumazine synthase